MRPIRDEVMDYLRDHPGVTNGQKIALAIGRPQSYSTVYRILSELRNNKPLPRGAHADYAQRGETRRRIEEYLAGHPGAELNSRDMAAALGLNESTVAKNMRAIIRARDAAKPAPAAKPAKAKQVAVRPAAPADSNGVTALLLRLQAGNVADIQLPPGLLIRMPGGGRYRDGVARDADGDYYELRRL